MKNLIALSQICLMVIGSFFFSSCEKDDEPAVTNETEENLPDITGYPIVDTDQTTFYNNYTEISEPLNGNDFYGQDATYTGNVPQYVNNEDGTITDMVTGLMWSQSTDLNGDGEIDSDDKLTYDEALENASSFSLAGYSDWRLPTIKELYSLILFSGLDVSGYTGSSNSGLIPFIDTDYFEFGYGDTDAGERIIDAQYASSSKYVDYTMDGNKTLFGVNFADGRIKGYGLTINTGQKTFYVLYARGNESYGINDFADNNDGTITDSATGLMWTKDDNGEGLLWKDALSYAETSEFGGYSDWRLPNVKELQSLVDYSRSPGTTSSAAIDALFNCTQITNEAGETDYPWYWSGTTHANFSTNNGGAGAYVCFGRAMGYMEITSSGWTDVHGAGAQRSDYKYDNMDNLTYVTNGYYFNQSPQGDAVRSYNYVRLVRNSD